MVEVPLSLARKQLLYQLSENEAAPTVTLATSASSVSESGSNLTLTATLSISTYEAVTLP